MQIVIDIPEEIKAVIDKNGTNEIVAETVWQAVKKGTPLPKGHGRLIDYGYVVGAIDDWVNAEEYRYTNATDYLRKRVANISAIIETNKEVQE